MELASSAADLDVRPSSVSEKLFLTFLVHERPGMPGLLYTSCREGLQVALLEILSLTVSWFKHHIYNSFQIQSDCVCYSSSPRITLL